MTAPPSFASPAAFAPRPLRAFGSAVTFVRSGNAPAALPSGNDGG